MKTSQTKQAVPAEAALQQEKLDKIARHYDQLEQKLAELEARLAESGLPLEEGDSRARKPR